MVLYFTGTGNSRYIAQKIAKALDEPLFSINDAIKEKDNTSSECTHLLWVKIYKTIIL